MPRADAKLGVDIEIWEVASPDDVNLSGVIIPQRLKINGVEVLSPAGKPIIENIAPLDGKTALTATLNVFVRSLVIHAEVPNA